ncbi:MAG: CopG family transcriptional regulator [Verrucomicrobiae bacterium]|nr:CopG family transcriptional regulator [Verrucomicrobiae bacterium]
MRKNIVYKDDDGELAGIEKARPLTGKEIKALGLPSPAELAREPAIEKVTIELESESLEFFRREAARRHASYQRMIRNLLAAYAKAMDDTPHPRRKAA